MKKTAVTAWILTVTLTPAFADVRSRLVIEPTKTQPRNSEGDLIELKDGRLCFVYSRFTGGESDHARADLAMRRSEDSGRTWGDDTIAVPFEGGKNVMSVSLLRLRTGEIALFYLRKRSLADCRPVLRLSNDETATWSDPIECIADEIGYYVLNNDRVVELPNGRLIAPVAQHTKGNEEWFAGRAMCYLSDDNGRTWRRSQSTLTLPPELEDRHGLQEPGVVALQDRRLLMFCRTGRGSLFLSHSSDDGTTWSDPVPSSLKSPLSPASIERIPTTGDLLCVWNDHTGRHDFEGGKRTPLCLAVSRDDGKTWSPSPVLESNPDGWYCYTSITPVGDQLFLSYCAGDTVVGRLNRLKMISISRAWLDEHVYGAQNDVARKPERCIDYGRSFITTKSTSNSPRFQVESTLRIVDPKTDETAEYYQCASTKCERVFGKSDLFCDDNYDFMVVFGDKESVIFRRKSRVNAPFYRQVTQTKNIYAGMAPKLKKVDSRPLITPDEVFEAIDAGTPLVGQTELRDERTGRIALLEYPVKTINWERDKKIWHITPGPVLLPDLSLPATGWSGSLKLAFIAYRSSFVPSAANRFPEWADLLVEEPTSVGDTSVYHYSGKVHRKARNRLFALESSER